MDAALPQRKSGLWHGEASHTRHLFQLWLTRIYIFHYSCIVTQQFVETTLSPVVEQAARITVYFIMSSTAVAQKSAKHQQLAEPSSGQASLKREEKEARANASASVSSLLYTQPRS